MDCINCGAPFSKGRSECLYCGSLKEGAAEEEISVVKVSDRICPECNINMDTVSIKATIPLFIERCRECSGLFFDPLELEELIGLATTEGDKNYDSKELTTLIAEEGGRGPKVTRYLKCPICTKTMNRKNYASHSGVVIDYCKSHGVWLNGGELNRVLRWERVTDMQESDKVSFVKEPKREYKDYKNKHYKDRSKSYKSRPKSQSLLSNALGFVAVMAVEAIKDAID